MTRLLTHSDLTSLLDPTACLTALADGFRVAEEVPVAGQRVRTDLPFPGTATALIPGLRAVRVARGRAVCTGVAADGSGR
ncbi:hypothetical protein [Streptomyces lasiicapitis]|uniref:hypothetical protein n=1 Tax=Streptomyces lasiicapitis TaxID=1923961 RepID=UPI003653ECE6